MEVIKKKIKSQKIELTEFLSILIRCPVCNSEKKLKLPKSVINQAKQLTTISIPKGLVCDHHFQAFVDKTYVVRGYQKVDFECANNLINSKKLTHRDGNNKEKEFSEYIIIEENYLAYKPKENQIIIEKKYNINDLKEEIDSKANKVKSKNKFVEINPRKNGMKKLKITLKEIYNEFWDFIDEDNEDFQPFIDKDNRRENITKTY